MYDTEVAADVPLRVFCSYASADFEVMTRLRRHLDGQSPDIDVVWHDEDILPGDDWWEEIQNQIGCSNVFVFLVSRDLLGSTYCERERELAEERKQTAGARIIPLLLHDMDLEATPFYTKQAMLRRDGALVPLDAWDPGEDPLARVAAEIRALPERLRRRRTGPGGRRRTTAGEQRLTIGVPARESPATGIDLYLEAVSRALRNDPGRPVAVTGGSGSGKSTAVAEYIERYAQDYDVVIWLNGVDTSLDWSSVQAATRLGLVSTDPDSARRGFRDWLAEHDDWLVVMDNATSSAEIHRLLPERRSRGHVLVTSRNHAWDAATAMPIWRLSEDAAVELVTSVSGTDDIPGVRLLVETLDRNPKALDLAARMIGPTLTPADYLGLLGQRT